MPNGLADPDFMLSLARGLGVLTAFADQREPLTVAEIARVTDMSRAASRRCLHTLSVLGYVEREGNRFTLKAKALSLGYAFLSSSTLAMRAQPLLDDLRNETGESCSLGVLEDGKVCYISRAETSRVMSVSPQIGSRLPLYCTSMGRVLLGGMSQADRARSLGETELVTMTPRTQTSVPALLAIIADVALEGRAIVDEELELGLRSIAVPVLGRSNVVAAMNIAAHAGGEPLDSFESRCLPHLKRAAQRLQMLCY